MTSRAERRRRAQSGTTLIELLVSLMIMGLLVVVLVGAFSTALLDATLAKRDVAVSAAGQYEIEKIGAAAFNDKSAAYSECFAVDKSAPPTQVGMGGSCPAGTNVRVDVSVTTVSPHVQQWTVQFRSYPALGTVGSAISVYKVNR
jgi:prepilin-type N-terminal cleavage/methylation domain-containing protein